MNKRTKLVLSNNPLLAGPRLQEREHTVVPYRELRLDAIDADPAQPRREFDEEKLAELADSLRRYGVLQPVLVRASDRAGRYVLVAGERRLRAARKAGLEVIPAVVSADKDSEAGRTLAVQLVENLQRADLSPLERARAIGALRDAHGLSVRDVAERLGVSKSMVQRSLDVLALPPDLLDALARGASEAKVLLLSKVEDEAIRAAYLKDLDVVSRDDLARAVARPAPARERALVAREDTADPEDARLAEEMQQALGVKVRLTRTAPGSAGGRVTIDFYSDADLQELFRRVIAE